MPILYQRVLAEARMIGRRFDENQGWVLIRGKREEPVVIVKKPGRDGNTKEIHFRQEHDLSLEDRGIAERRASDDLRHLGRVRAILHCNNYRESEILDCLRRWLALQH